MKAAIFSEVEAVGSLSNVRVSAIAHLLADAFRTAGSPHNWNDIDTAPAGVRDMLLRAYSSWSRNPRQASVESALRSVQPIETCEVERVDDGSQTDRIGGKDPANPAFKVEEEV